MKKLSRLDYAYAVGRVRALERHLVSRSVFSQAAEEKDLFGVLKVIFDAGKFHEETLEIQDSEELDVFLNREEDVLMRTVSEILLESNVLNILELEEYPEEALALTEEKDYPFIRNYVRHKIDLGNLKMLIRSKHMGFPFEKYSQMMLKGGFLEEGLLRDSYDLPFPEIGDRLYATPYKEAWNRAADALVEKETFVELERGFEDFMMGYLREAKRIVFGPEPVFSYALARKRELSLVRLVGVGKMNGLLPAVIKERISETYV